MEEERGRRGKGRGFGGLNALGEDDEESLDVVAEENSSDDSSVDEPPAGKKKSSVWGNVAEDQVSSMQRDMQKTAISKEHPHHRHRQPATSRKAVPAKRTGRFELNMDGATLLSRRGKMDANVGVGSDGAAKAATKALKVGS
jgi:hypothetical protein